MFVMSHKEANSRENCSLGCKESFRKKLDVFWCIHASLKEDLSVRPPIRPQSSKIWLNDIYVNIQYVTMQRNSIKHRKSKKIFTSKPEKSGLCQSVHRPSVGMTVSNIWETLWKHHWLPSDLFFLWKSPPLLRHCEKFSGSKSRA